MESMKRTVEQIAKQKLRLDTLETRVSDSLDFSEHSVRLLTEHAIREALEAAFVAGWESSTEFWQGKKKTDPNSCVEKKFFNSMALDFRIWKYGLSVVGLQKIRMPKSARILSVENQSGNLCLWALCDTTQELIDREIEIIGAGNPISLNSRNFIGTVLDNGFVWHVFERLD